MKGLRKYQQHQRSYIHIFTGSQFKDWSKLTFENTIFHLPAFYCFRSTFPICHSKSSCIFSKRAHKYATKNVKKRKSFVELFLGILSFKACRKMAPFVPFEKKQEKLFGFHLVRLTVLHIQCMVSEIDSIFH